MEERVITIGLEQLAAGAVGACLGLALAWQGARGEGGPGEGALGRWAAALFSGLWWALWLGLEPGWRQLDGAFGGSLLVAAAYVDWRSYLLPNRLNLALGCLGAVGACLRGQLGEALAAGAAAGLGFALLYYGTGGLGLGDVKLAAASGLYLGSWQAGYLAALLALASAGAVALWLLASGRRQAGSCLAFGPYLAAATLVVKAAGGWLWPCYLRLLGLA